LIKVPKVFGAIEMHRDKGKALRPVFQRALLFNEAYAVLAACPN
jgi:hypothetical protein